jgi:lysophospholipase L1-like esterase
MTEERELPQIVLFGDSLTQWSFNEQTRGFGWVLEDKYAGKAEIVNEGTYYALFRTFQSPAKYICPIGQAG